MYLLSSTSLTPTGEEFSLAPGTATNNSYLVVGEKQALLIDLMVEEEGLKAYAKALAGVPVRLALTHGHPDHVFRLGEFEDVWMHPADEYLFREGVMDWPVIEPSPRVHALSEGDVIDLGGRRLEVYHVPGHTPGSLLFLEPESRLLFSDDTVARRLLYGLHDYVPTDEFCASLGRIYGFEFDFSCSAHDRCLLPKWYIPFMTERIQKDYPGTKKSYMLADGREMKWLVWGDVYSLRFFDMSCPAGCED